jgi:hypothetical protein
VNVPKPVRQKAIAQGAAGQLWLTGLADLVRSLERDWEFRVGETLDGGSKSYVATAGDSAVLKVAMPGGPAADLGMGLRGTGFHRPFRVAGRLPRNGSRRAGGR